MAAVLLVVAYFAAGSLGQFLAIPPGNVTLVWPPSGIALAVVLLGYGRLWPGIWLGSLLVNVRTLFDPAGGASPVASLAVGSAIATGSTIQALAGGRLIARLAGGTRCLEQARGAFLFAAGAAIACLIGSTAGAGSLALGGFVPRSALGFTWRTWWLGDTAGIIVVAPLILAWSRRRGVADAFGGRLEASALIVLLLAAGHLIFGGWPLGAESGTSAAYLAFPLMTWAALRFGHRGATAAVAIMSAISILGAASGSGPFRNAGVQESLWLLQTFGIVLALSTLTLAAVVFERRRMEENLNDCNRNLERRVTERSALAERRAEDLAWSEEAHREKARTLRAVLDNILEGVVVADSQGRSILWNPAAERYLGVGFQAVAPEDWPSTFGCFQEDQATPYPACRLPLERALRGETIKGEDVYLCHPSLHPSGVWLRLSAVPLRDSSGGTVGGVAVLRDISESKQAELRLQSVIESALAGFVMVDELGRIVLVNRQAEAIFGYKREELYGQPVKILVPDMLGRDPHRYFRGFVRDPGRCRMSAPREVRGLRKDGRPVDLLVALNPIRQNSGHFVLASILDNTEQKRAVDLLRSVVEFSPDGTIAVDREGRIVLVSREAERMFGYRREELLGQPLWRLLTESDRVFHREAFRKFIAERRRRSVSLPRDLFVRRKDGGEFPADIMLHSYELHGEDFAVVDVRDMTERRRLMAEVRIHLRIQEVISQILRCSLEPIGLDEHLRQSLELILSVPWFSTPARGAILLVDGEDGRLAVRADHGLDPDFLSSCAFNHLGRCLCGHAASHREIVLGGRPDETPAPGAPRHAPQGFYCVPILDGERHGIICVFVDETHPRKAEEEEFLSSVARILAGTLERRRAEQALRRSEARFRAISEAAPLGIFLTDAEGDCLYTNRAYVELTGRSSGESLGKAWKENVHPDDRDRVFAEWYESALNRLPFESTYRFKHRDGRTIWVSGKSAEIRVGNALTGYVGVVEDITQKRTIIEALRRSEERFDLAVRGTDAGIWDWDLRTDTLYFSPRWKSMLGYAEDEIGDGFHEWESRLHPADHDRALAAIRVYLEGRSSEYELEHRLRHKDGSYRWILARGAAVRDPDGRPTRMVGSHIDITDHKQTADRLNENLIQLRAAQRIQQALLPQRPPALAGLEIAGASYPAAYAGGDMFNYLPMLGGNLGILIGDVSGHGLGAALQMASTQACVRSLSQTCATVGEVITRVNRFLFEETEGDSFVTLMLIQLDPRTRSLTYANAGHPSGFVLDPSGAVRVELVSSAIPLGIEERYDFSVAEPVVLRPGELVVLVTDGILEARSPAGELFGNERLLEVVRASREQPGTEILELLHRAVGHYTGTGVLEDDVTAVVIKVAGEAS